MEDTSLGLLLRFLLRPLAALLSSLASDLSSERTAPVARVGRAAAAEPLRELARFIVERRS